MSEETRDASAVGEAIMIARGLRGWSAHELAERIGVPASTIRAWEQATASPDQAVIPVLAEVLELDARDLVVESTGDPDAVGPHSAATGTEEESPPDAAGTLAQPEPLTMPDMDMGNATFRSEPSTVEATEPPPVRTIATQPPPFPVQADEPHSATTRESVIAPSRRDPADPLQLLTSAATWVRDRWRRRRLLARAPTQFRSYVEDDRQSTTYRIRQVLTAVVLIVLILLLRWAWNQFAEAVSTLFDTLRSAV